MAIYNVREIDSDTIHEVFWSYDEYESRKREDGALRLDNGKYGFVDLSLQFPDKHEPGDGWPRASYSAGVTKKQVKKAMAVDRSLGVPTQYDHKARPVFTSQAHQDRWCKAHKATDWGR